MPSAASDAADGIHEATEGVFLERIGVIFDCDGTLIDSMGVWRELEEEMARRAGAPPPPPPLERRNTRPHPQPGRNVHPRGGVVGYRFGVLLHGAGRLIDSLGGCRELAEERARRAGAALAPADIELINTLTIPESGRYFHERFGLGSSSEEVVGMMNDFILGYYRDRAEARLGVMDFIDALAQRGVAMTVASSSPQAYLQAGLKRTGIAPYMDAIVSVDDVGKPKREPDVYDHARAIMGTSLAATWGFEDSIYAVRTLVRANYGVVGVYDRDDSGTWDQLEAEASFAIRSFEDLSADAFIEQARMRASRCA